MAGWLSLNRDVCVGEFKSKPIKSSFFKKTRFMIYESPKRATDFMNGMEEDALF